MSTLTRTTLDYVTEELNRQYLAHEMSFDAYAAALEDVQLCLVRIPRQQNKR